MPDAAKPAASANRATTRSCKASASPIASSRPMQQPCPLPALPLSIGSFHSEPLTLLRPTRTLAFLLFSPWPGGDPATQQPRVGAAIESLRSQLDGRLLAGHGEERVIRA